MYIKTEIQDAVEIITIDRPQALNALNPEVLEELKAAFEAVDQSTVRCIVLTGAGEKSFVAGADIASMSKMTKAEGEAFGKLGNDIFMMIEKFPIPVIAAVGHESDIAISDFVADIRAATPTDAANIAVPDTHLIRDELDRIAERMRIDLGRHLAAGENRMQACSMDLLGQILRDRIRMREERADALMGRLEALDPRHTLERGYAMVQSGEGEILTGTGNMQAGDEIRLIMKDGTADAQVLRTETEKEQ